MPEPLADGSRGQRPRITVFGGTGFLGRRIVRHLLQHGFAVRVAVRHPVPVRELFSDVPVEAVEVDIHDEGRVAQALIGTVGAVNAVSLYRERGRQTFRSVHIDAAERVARHVRDAGITRFVHVSGIGADPSSASAYIRARGLGERAVMRVLPDACVLRSAVMFGTDDAFLTTIIDLLRTLPAYPMFGKGETRLQPVHVEDVGEAVAVLLTDTTIASGTYEIGGPEIFTYAGLLRAIAAEIHVRPALLSMSYSLWFGLAGMLNPLPNPPVSRNQIELMQIDTVASTDKPGLNALGIAATGLREVVREIRDIGK